MRLFKIITFGCLLVLAFSLFCAGTASSQDAVEGKYFTVYYGNCDLAEIAHKLDAEYFLHIDVFSRKQPHADFNSLIVDLFDSLYLEVSDILDIHMYNFKGTVRILPTKAGVKDYLIQYMANPPDMPSFYLEEKNTIYISFADMTLGMLSHEMAHAIISKYFVVPPPVKVQEVLAGYVEYSIRKSTGTLPASLR